MIIKKIFTYPIFIFIFCALMTFGFIFSNKLDNKVFAQAESGEITYWDSNCYLPSPTPIPYHTDGNLKIYEDYNPLADPFLNAYYNDNSCLPDGYYSQYYNSRYVLPLANPIIDRFCGGGSLDIAIAMDTSSSLGYSEYLKEKESIKSFIRSFKGQGNIRISLTIFSRSARKIFGLLEEKDWENMCNTIDGFGISPFTYWDHALQVATSTFDESSRNRSKLIAFFTDGGPNEDWRFVTAKANANIAKAQGIRILAILIGDNSDNIAYPEDKMRQISGLRELIPISSGNYSERDVSYADFISASFDSLQKSLKDFTNAACPISCTPDCSTKCGGEANSCGGTCPNPCSPDQACLSGGTCCTPNCAGKCGGVADSCGGSCWNTCLIGQVCNTGTCCTPDCSTKCGGEANSCGGTCPNPCSPDQACLSGGTCCTPNCAGKCGGVADDCEGSCWNACAGGQVCRGGSCTSSLTNEGWFKLKNTSFNNLDTERRDNIVPNVVSGYDSDDTSEKQLIVGEGGIVITDNSFNMYNTNRYSNNNWLLQEYKPRKQFSNSVAYANYLELKSSGMEPITSLKNIEISDKNIFYYNQDLTINDVTLPLIDKKNMVLVVNGNIDFNLGDATFNPSHSIVFVAKKIMFYDKNSATVPNTNWSGILSSAKGIFIADTFDLGNSIDMGIKITGNLIALKSPIINSRRQTDYTKPSVFVIFDPKIYLDTIPTIGAKTYDWSQR